MLLEDDNKFTATAFQDYRIKERELDDWKVKEETELKEDYQYKLSEMRTEYHEKLVDINKSYHQKDAGLEKERQALERDLQTARGDMSVYGGDFNETAEYGMILPDSISAREQSELEIHQL